MKVVADEGTDVTVQQETHGRIYYNILKKKNAISFSFILYFQMGEQGSIIWLEIIWLRKKLATGVSQVRAKTLQVERV